MRKSPIYLLVFMTLCFLSCKKEDVEDLIPETEEVAEDTPNDDVPDEVIPDVPENVITTPCDFDLSNVAANSTIILNCVLDLSGQTIKLPSNVKFEFEGGDITGGGTLIFAGGTIDGRLLSDQLNIQGNVTLKDPEFAFYAVRWGIVEGNTTSDIALQNNTKLENLMNRVKELGATTFSINKLDAFFEVTKVTSTTTNQNFYASKEAITLPSDFHLKMTDETKLRMFPAEDHIENGSVLAVRRGSNIKVTGGNIIGDNGIRGYTPDDKGLQGTHLFHIHSGKNITIEGVNFIRGSSGGLDVYSFGFAFNPADYDPTTGIKVLKCTFRDNRRMAITITDGRDMLLKGNVFINSGQPYGNADGGEVGYAINIEPERTRDSNGDLKEFQRAFDITIKDNKEINSRIGFVAATIGQNITVDNNDIETKLIYSLTSGTKIINNRFNAPPGSDIASGFAIFAAGGRGETIFNNEVANNQISGYGVGISTSTKDASIHHNTITNCALGIQVNKTLDSQIFENTMSVSNIGILFNLTFADKVTVRNNTITANGFHIKSTKLNQAAEEANYKVTIEDNNFVNKKMVSIFNANGIIFKNNDLTGGMEIQNATNIEVLANKIKPSQNDGIRLAGSHSSVSIQNNTISEPAGASYQCIKNNSETPNNIQEVNNTCS